jgi:hypothetical protein
MRALIRRMAVSRKTQLGLALAGALLGVLKVSDAYAQSGCWNGGVATCGTTHYCIYQAGASCVVCTN